MRQSLFVLAIAVFLFSCQSEDSKQQLSDTSWNIESYYIFSNDVVLEKDPYRTINYQFSENTLAVTGNEYGDSIIGFWSLEDSMLATVHWGDTTWFGLQFSEEEIKLEGISGWVEGHTILLSQGPARQAESNNYEKTMPEWAKNAVIYEVNLRQYSEEGTFAAFQSHIPRLKDLGVDILWFMPIHPIGELNRKGSLGSYYSVKDYLAVDPAYGTEEDFRSLVTAAHDAGMYVIIDWVANHSAWDNALTQSHPQWYTKDADGNMMPPVADWSDVADFNYGNADLWDYQIQALRFWVEEFDIDGYRCDVADWVPRALWERARQELDGIKPVFMLAEAENPLQLKQGFDMTYAWELHHMMNAVARGEKNVNDLVEYRDRELEKYSSTAVQMVFTSNHDENSWNGTVDERMGDAKHCFAAFSYIWPGMPLIYSGQEAGLDKRLEFFEKDVIAWKEDPFFKLYQQLNQIKHENPALWNGIHGGAMEILEATDEFLVIQRTKEEHMVIGIFNLNEEAAEIAFSIPEGSSFTSLNGESIDAGGSFEKHFGPWEYDVLWTE